MKISLKVSKAEKDFICYTTYGKDNPAPEKHIIKKGEDIYWRYIGFRDRNPKGFCKDCYDSLEMLQELD
jgi:hypothetical protein